MSDDLKHVGAVHGEPTKPYMAFRDVDGTNPLQGFNTLAEAHAYIGSHPHRTDWHFLIRERRTIIWPESRIQK